MIHTRRIEALEVLARDLVGDGQHPDLFFVGLAGNIQMVTTDRESAYAYWRHLAACFPTTESALENRREGVIAAIEPIDETDNAPLVCHDEYHRWFDG